MRAAIFISAILLTGLLVTSNSPAEIPPGMAGATFVVHCYDVGVSTLSGKTGVLSVQRGWSGGREVDRVVYDPQQVSLENLEDWLKDAGTYVRTLEGSKAK